MIYHKEPSTGIDKNIYALQKELHESLMEEWNLGDDDYQCYGRTVKNPVSLGYMPCIYMGNGDYKEVLPDDQFAVQSFFGLSDKETAKGKDDIADVHLIFFINLGLISRDNPGRDDIEARSLVKQIMRQNLHGFSYTGLATGMQSVFPEYTIAKNSVYETSTQNKRGLRDADMHPFHTFRINGTIRYSIY